ncbi:MAG: ADP-ribosylglycohydrolase family protein [Kiritimatiellia bacterium]
MKRSCALLLLCGLTDGLFAAEDVRRLSLEDYRDHMKGAWIGQMVGVAWGAPTEFRWNDKMIPADKVPAWTSDLPLRMAYGNDDLYVEMTFLKTLEDHGLDVDIRQAGIDFANSEYQLWCANLTGRTNLRKGIAPPDCSHPKFSRNANDIDYQIESDYAGIIAPGCPQEVVRLGGVFGRLMNFGDGVWAGQFVGALYAEAFFTSDVNRLLDAGLAAIPPESDYARMVRSVRAWHRENPADWTACWEKIRAAYSKRFNRELRDSNGGIDVRLNGAAIVLGMLYGAGEPERAMELSMRCGWDSDCNPSSVGGILMCARGAKALPEKYTEKLDLRRKFSYTAYDLTTLYAVCEKLARQVVVRQGGRIETAADGAEWFVIPRQQVVPDPFVPSWAPGAIAASTFTAKEMAKQKFAIRTPDPETLKDPDPTKRVQKALDALWPGWKTSVNAPDMNPGYRETVETDKGKVAASVLTHPPKQETAAILYRTVKVPSGRPTLHFEVSPVGGDFRLVVRIDGVELLATDLETPGKPGDGRLHLQAFDLSLEPWTGREVTIELLNQPTGWSYEAALWHNLRLTANSEGF